MYLNIYQIHFLIRMTCYHIHQAISAAINAKPAPLRVLVPTLGTNLKGAYPNFFLNDAFERPATRATPAPIPVASMKQSLKEPPLVWVSSSIIEQSVVVTKSINPTRAFSNFRYHESQHPSLTQGLPFVIFNSEAN